MAGALRRKRQPVIGVMAVQGDFREHLETLDAVGAVGREIRLPADLDGVDGLILPGGESTAMRKLYSRWSLVAPIKALATRGAPILGTCAGAILLATTQQLLTVTISSEVNVLVLGVMLVLFVVVAPEGIIGLARKVWRLVRRGSP